ncbi:MAG: hypothetical protein ACRDZQ_02000 [Acidimicrobiales bacterium]
MTVEGRGWEEGLLAVAWPMDVRMSEQVRELVEALPEVVVAWEHAVFEHDEAVRRQRSALSRAERHLEVVLRGMSLRRWQNRVAGKVAILTATDGREVNSARRRRPEVEAALAALAGTRAEGGPRVQEAAEALATATRRLLAYGSMAEALTGRSITELAHLARNPRRSSAHAS